MPRPDVHFARTEHVSNQGVGKIRSDFDEHYPHGLYNGGDGLDGIARAAAWQGLAGLAPRIRETLPKRRL